MKIHIQYQTNAANPAVVAVETPDLKDADDAFDAEATLKHGADALNMALKTLWGDKAALVKPESISANDKKISLTSAEAFVILDAWKNGKDVMYHGKTITPADVADDKTFADLKSDADEFLDSL